MYIQTILRRYKGLLIGIIGSIILFNNLLRYGSMNVLWIDKFDSKLLYWIINWGYHVLFESLSPFGFWNANSFYPNLGTLAYSDSLLSAQIVFAPLRLIGIPPLTSMYFTFAIICILGCVLTSYVLDRIGYFSPWENAFIVLCTHFSLSMITFFGHYQLIGFQLAPPFFLFVYLYLRDFQTKDLLFASFILIVGVCFAMYLAPIYFTIIFFLVALIVLRWKFSSQLKVNFKKIGLTGILIVAGFSILLYFIQIREYIKVSQQFPDQPLLDTATYSANIHSIIDGFSVNSYWYDPRGYIYGGWEYSYFPGYILLISGFSSVLLLIFISLKLYSHAKKSTRLNINLKSRATFTSITRMLNRKIGIDPFFLLYIVLFFVLCIVLSWGPYFKWSNEIHQEIKLPFYYLDQVFPGISSIRAPGRFGMFIGLPLAIFVVVLVRLLISSNRGRNVLVVILLAGVMIESIPSFDVYDFSADPEGIYQRIDEIDLSESPLIELPVMSETHFDTINNVLDQLVGSTYHWSRLFVGYGAKFTYEYEKLLTIDQQIQNYEASPRRAVDFGTRYGVSYYLIHLDEYDQIIAESWMRYIRKNSACILLEQEGNILFSVDASVCKQSKATNIDVAARLESKAK